VEEREKRRKERAIPKKTTTKEQEGDVIESNEKSPALSPHLFS
jgi:hypothetical protein